MCNIYFIEPSCGCPPYPCSRLSSSSSSSSSSIGLPFRYPRQPIVSYPSPANPGPEICQAAHLRNIIYNRNRGYSYGGSGISGADSRLPQFPQACPSHQRLAWIRSSGRPCPMCADVTRETRERERRERRRRGIEQQRERERERCWREERTGFLGGGRGARGGYGEREDFLGERLRGMNSGRRRRRESGNRGFMLDREADLRRWTLERMHRRWLRSRTRGDEEILYG